ncbi:MAG: hypothetical protein NVS3B5_10620 [Sphingomicrobium sp.]
MQSSSLRTALGSFVTGVTVITTVDEAGLDYGVTANSFNSVSLEPPLVLWSLAKNSSSLPAFANAARFAIHVLASDQVDLSARFAQRGTDKFAELAFERGEKGVPLLSGCSARFICRPAYSYEGGDHVIFVGEVLEFEHRDIPPLAFHGGSYAVTAKRKKAAEVSFRSLTHLIQSCYFHLLTPVREERERLSISLREHYLLNALYANPGLDLAGINEIIGYTGVRAEEFDASSLVKRGFLQAEGEGELERFRLTRRGREVVIGLIGASVVMESELATSLGVPDLDILKELLVRVLDSISAASPEPVQRHMALLEEIQAGVVRV